MGAQLDNNNNQALKRSSILTRYPSIVSAKEKEKPEVQSEGSQNDWLNKYLPRGILISVFLNLSRKDQLNAARVCKHFRAVSKDHIFDWVLFYEAHFETFSYDTKMRDQLILTQTDFRRILESSYSFGFYKNESLLFVVHPHQYWGSEGDKDIADNTAKFLKLSKTEPFMYRYSMSAENGWNKKNFNLKFFINCQCLEEQIKKEEDIPALDAVVAMVKGEASKVAKKRFKQFVGDKSVKVPLKSMIAPKQPSGMKAGYFLYKYQLDAVKWMASLEADIAAKIPIKYANLLPWYKGRMDVLFNLNKKIVVTQNKIEDHIVSFVPKGGVLADEMGLGKTIEILGLILANPQNQKLSQEVDLNSVQPTDSPEEMLKKLRFKSKATLIICPNHLVHQWTEEFKKFADPPLKILSVTSMPHLRASSYEEMCKLDAVIFSSQLLHYAHYQNIGKEKIPFIGEARSKIPPPRPVQVAKHLQMIRTMMAQGKKIKEPALLEHLKWYQIVIDEAHEQLVNEDFQAMFSSLSCKFLWHVSGTPFPSENALQRLIQRIEFPWDKHVFPVGKYYHTDCVFKYVFADILWNNLYWRNTKESIKDEYVVPRVVEDLVLLNFTDVEKAMYHDFDDVNKKVLCSKMPQVGTCTTLSEIKQVKVPQKQELIKRLKKKIESYKQEVASLEGELRKTKQWEDLNKEHKEAVKMLEQTKVKLQHEEEVLVLYKAAKTLKESNANDGAAKSNNNTSQPLVDIATSNNNDNEEELGKDEMNAEERSDEEPTEKDISVMSVQQLKEAINKYNVTPKKKKKELQKQLKELIEKGTIQEKPTKKRKSLTKKNAALKNKKQKQEATTIDVVKPLSLESPTELLELIEVLGTKMANLIYYLKKLWIKTPDARVIIFSQFDAVLSEVNQLLAQYGIQTVSVKGNANQKTTALISFKDSDSKVKVILLSLNKAASGSNLIQASHVVLIDPISGTKEEVEAIESQAIGRAYRQGQLQHVIVVRFLIKDTEEHFMYLKIYTQESTKTTDTVAPLKRAGSTLLFRAFSVAALVANVPADDTTTVTEIIELVEPKIEISSTGETPQQQQENQMNEDDA